MTTETAEQTKETTWTLPKASSEESTEESTVATASESEKTTETKETTETNAASEKPSEEGTKESSTEDKTSEKSASSEETSTESDETKKTEREVPAPTEYTLPEGMPQEVGEFAHNNDMTQSQLDNSLQFFGSYMTEMDKYQQKQIREAGEAHVEEWGDNKDTNLALVRRTLKTVDKSGKLTELLDSTGYGNHPAVLDFFLEMGQEFKEGGFLPSEVNRPTGKTTAAQALFGKNHPSKQN